MMNNIFGYFANDFNYDREIFGEVPSRKDIDKPFNPYADDRLDCNCSFSEDIDYDLPKDDRYEYGCTFAPEDDSTLASDADMYRGMLADMEETLKQKDAQIRLLEEENQQLLLKLKQSKSPAYKEMDTAMICRLHREGYSLRAIAEQLGHSRGAIKERLVKGGLL